MILLGLWYPSNIVIDVSSDRMYWLEGQFSEIRTATLNGTILSEFPITRAVKWFSLLGNLLLIFDCGINKLSN